MNQLATEPQRKKFFALAKDLGYEANIAKDRAKIKYNLESFTQITSEQISPIIDTMQNKLNTTPHKHQFACTKCHTHLELVFIPED